MSASVEEWRAEEALTITLRGCMTNCCHRPKKIVLHDLATRRMAEAERRKASCLWADKDATLTDTNGFAFV